VDLTTNNDYFPTQIILLVFITETVRVYCAVQTECLNKNQVGLMFKKFTVRCWLTKYPYKKGKFNYYLAISPEVSVTTNCDNGDDDYNDFFE
jgi:hypothetical protein